VTLFRELFMEHNGMAGSDQRRFSQDVCKRGEVHP
jgi:hypothetical protein